MRSPIRIAQPTINVKINNCKELRAYLRNIFDLTDDDLWWGDATHGETEGWFEYQNRNFNITVERSNKDVEKYTVCIDEDYKNFKTLVDSKRNEIQKFVKDYIISEYITSCDIGSAEGDKNVKSNLKKR